jgi:hypothetical protein
VDQEAVKRFGQTSSLFVLLAASLVTAACTTKKAPADEVSAPVTASATGTATVPPVAFSSTPLEGFADAGPIDGKTPFDQARAYEASGQHWMARLVLEKKALGADGTTPELELLAVICHTQGDDACVEECGRRLGKKLKFDGGAPKMALAASEHKEPESDLAKARDHLLQHRLTEARALLEPKVLDGKASKEEVRLLKSVCKEQGDRMCVALCDAKLRS